MSTGSSVTVPSTTTSTATPAVAGTVTSPSVAGGSSAGSIPPPLSEERIVELIRATIRAESSSTVPTPSSSGSTLSASPAHLAGTSSAAVNLSASLLPSGVAPSSGALSAAEAFSTTTLPSLGSLLASNPLSSWAPPPCRAKPLVYSPALPPIQAKALEKIRSGVFFDLKELLPDNVALIQRLQEIGAVALLSSPPPASRLREINNPLTWVYCFLSFIAAKTECSATRELVAYAQIVVQLARKHGGLGWLAYDQHFRQQLAGGSGAMWNDINNSLMSATVLAPSSDEFQKRTICSVWRGDDHSASECALRAIQPPGRQPQQHQQNPAPNRDRSAKRQHPYKGWETLCRNYNKGHCHLEEGSCKFEHTCILCGRSGHGAKDCSDKPSSKGKGKAPPRSAPDQGSS